MLCQYRAQLLCQLIHLVVGLCRQQIEEYARGTRQQVIVIVLLIVHRDNRIVKRRLLGVIDNLLYLLILTTDTLHEGLLEVLQADAVERRRVVRRVIWLKKRVYPFILLIHNILFSLSACKVTTLF